MRSSENRPALASKHQSTLCPFSGDDEVQACPENGEYSEKIHQQANLKLSRIFFSVAKVRLTWGHANGVK
jgi:hypothetical protein